jgi:hypothetical protein
LCFTYLVQRDDRDVMLIPWVTFIVTLELLLKYG